MKIAITFFKLTFFLFFLFLFSCTKTEETKPEYVGTWESKIGDIRSVFTFNENTYKRMLTIK